MLDALVRERAVSRPAEEAQTLVQRLTQTFPKDGDLAAELVRTTIHGTDDARIAELVGRYEGPDAGRDALVEVCNRLRALPELAPLFSE